MMPEGIERGVGNEGLASAAFDLVISWWKSQILYTGVSLGAFEALDVSAGRSAEEVARLIGADPSALYRLLRALASLGLLQEQPNRSFTTTETGALFRSTHPYSLRAVALLEAGPELVAAWRHLPDVVRSGTGTGVDRQFGTSYWAMLQSNPAYARVFADAMSGLSAQEVPAIRSALRTEPFHTSLICDVGGSHGALLAGILEDHREANGVAFELPEVVASHVASSSRVEGKPSIEFVAGDMFEAVPTADVYFLKHILHDWPDVDCLRILASMRKAANQTSRLFVCDFVVPGPSQPHFSKLFDISMMTVLQGRERTLEELASLLARTGWHLTRSIPLKGSPLSVLEAVPR